MKDSFLISKTDKQTSVGFTPESIEGAIKYIQDNCINTVFIDGDLKFEGFEFLNQCPTVTTLALNNNGIDTSQFPVLENIKYLFLNNFKGLFLTDRFPQLYECTMDWSNKMKIVTHSNNLKRLIIWSYNPKSKSLKDIVEFENLEYLEITSSNVTDLQMIGCFGCLKELKLSYLTKLTSLSTIETLAKTLEILIIGNAKKLEDYAEIASLHNLKRLSLCSCGNIENIRFIKKLPKLKDFIFAETTITDGDLTPCIGLDYVGFTPNKKHYSHKMEDFLALPLIYSICKSVTPILF